MQHAPIFFRILIVLGSSGLFLSPRLYGESLDLQQAISEALDHSPQIKAAAAQVEIARWKRIEALSGYLPVISISSNYLTNKKYLETDIALPGATTPVSIPQIIPTTLWTAKAQLGIFDGFVARRAAEVGQYATASAPLFGFVDATDRWVICNLKETEIGDIIQGTKVDITVDAISGRNFTGKVQQLSPSTGATFTMIPPDNATGNFTKVVQRVPIKISIEGVTPEEISLLRAGLSADVRVHRRKS